MSSDWAYKSRAQPRVLALSPQAWRPRHCPGLPTIPTPPIRALFFARTQKYRMPARGPIHPKDQAQSSFPNCPSSEPSCRLANRRSVGRAIRWVWQPSPDHRRAIRRARRTGSTPPPWHWSAARLAATDLVELGPYHLQKDWLRRPKSIQHRPWRVDHARTQKLPRRHHARDLHSTKPQRFYLQVRNAELLHRNQTNGLRQRRRSRATTTCRGTIQSHPSSTTRPRCEGLGAPEPPAGCPPRLGDHPTSRRPIGPVMLRRPPQIHHAATDLEGHTP